MVCGGEGEGLLSGDVAIGPAAVAEEMVEQEEEEEGEGDDIGRLHGFPVLGVTTNEWAFSILGNFLMCLWCCICTRRNEALPQCIVWHLVLGTQSLTLVEVHHLATCYSLLEVPHSTGYAIPDFFLYNIVYSTEFGTYFFPYQSINLLIRI